jgi:hypothetical protein
MKTWSAIKEKTTGNLLLYMYTLNRKKLKIDDINFMPKKKKNQGNIEQKTFKENKRMGK